MIVMGGEGGRRERINERVGREVGDGRLGEMR